MDDRETQRQPPPDEQLGMAWWNRLGQWVAANWLQRVDSSVPTNARAKFKEQLHG